MKTPLTPLISITTIVLWSLMMFTNNALAAELTINVDNIDTKRSGNILVMLFSSRGFPKRQRLTAQAKAARLMRRNSPSILIRWRASSPLKYYMMKMATGRLAKTGQASIQQKGLASQTVSAWVLPARQSITNPKYLQRNLERV